MALKYSLEQIFLFGKFKGETLKTAIEKDCEWVIWAIKNIQWFDISKEAEEYLEEAFFNLKGKELKTELKKEL
jgi:hypothetical protein